LKYCITKYVEQLQIAQIIYISVFSLFCNINIWCKTYAYAILPFENVNK